MDGLFTAVLPKYSEVTRTNCAELCVAYSKLKVEEHTIDHVCEIDGVCVEG